MGNTKQIALKILGSSDEQLMTLAWEALKAHGSEGWYFVSWLRFGKAGGILVLERIENTIPTATITNI